MSYKQQKKSSNSKEQQTFVTNTTWRWSQKIILFIIFSLVVNHLATRDSFPGSERYRFPIEGFLSSIALCILIGTIAELNFKFYKKKYFSKKEIIDIVSVISLFGYLNRWNDTLGTVLEDIPEEFVEDNLKPLGWI